MQLRNKLSYIALSSLLMLIGMLASSVFMPNLFAQRDGFEEIRCARLNIVGNNRQPRVVITADENGGLVGVLNNDSLAQVGLYVTEDGGSVDVWDNDGEGKARLSINRP